MIRGTTPTIVYKIAKGLDLTTVTGLEIVFKQTSTMLVKTLPDAVIDAAGSTVSVNLSQEETLKFNPGTLQTQIRFDTTDGVFATPVKNIRVDKILKGGVLGE